MKLQKPKSFEWLITLFLLAAFSMILSLRVGLLSRSVVNLSGLILLQSTDNGTLPEIVPDNISKLPVTCMPVSHSSIYRSIQLARLAVSLDRNSYRANDMLGRALLADCQLSDAQQAFSYSGNLSNSGSKSVVGLGTIALYKGNPLLAIDMWERAGLLAPIMDVGNVALNSSEWALAEYAFIAAFRVLEKRDGFDEIVAKAAALRGRSRAYYFRTRDFTGAKELMEQSLALDPENLYTMVFYGDLYLEEVDTLTASNWYLSAHEKFSESWLPLSRLGLSALASGDTNQAKKHYLEAIEVAPDVYHLYLHLGDIYLRLNDPDKAVQTYTLGKQKFGNQVFQERLDTYLSP